MGCLFVPKVILNKTLNLAGLSVLLCLRFGMLLLTDQMDSIAASIALLSTISARVIGESGLTVSFALLAWL